MPETWWLVVCSLIVGAISTYVPLTDSGYVPSDWPPLPVEANALFARNG